MKKCFFLKLDCSAEEKNLLGRSWKGTSLKLGWPDQQMLAENYLKLQL